MEWSKLHDVVGTVTEKTVGDFVRANVDRIHREVELRIQRVFDVDPTMRADMQVVAVRGKRICGRREEEENDEE